MAHTVPTRAFLQLSPDTTMLFAPFGYTHPPDPIPPYLLTQNVSPKDIAGSYITSSKSHDGFQSQHQSAKTMLEAQVRPSIHTYVVCIICNAHDRRTNIHCQKWRPFKARRLFSKPIKEIWPTQCQPRAFYSQALKQPCYLSPAQKTAKDITGSDANVNRQTRDFFFV